MKFNVYWAWKINSIGFGLSMSWPHYNYSSKTKKFAIGLGICFIEVVYKGLIKEQEQWQK